MGGGLVTVAELRDRPLTPERESLRRLETLLSPYTGVVRDVHTLLTNPLEAPLVKVKSRIARHAEDQGELGSGGYASSIDRARAAALGEAAERYAGALACVQETAPTPARELVPDAVSPARFALFAPEQHANDSFPFDPFTDATPVRWVEGFALPDQARALLPSQLVRLSWSELSPGETAIGYSTSNGLACGPSLEESVLAGLLELVERDAFMLAWTNRLSLPLLDWSDDDRLLEFEERYVAPTRARCDVVDLSVFLQVPAALAVVHGDGERTPAVAVGAGAGTTVQVAVEKAIAEAFAVRSWGLQMLLTDPEPWFAPDFSDLVTFRDHIRCYIRDDHVQATAFLVASTDSRTVSSVAPLPTDSPLAAIREIARRLARQGASAYAVDLTPTDLASAGLAVAKVVAPELCALDARHDARFLGGERLRNVPAELGLAAHPLQWADINPYPHPFP
jgi:ribosomal protein S12 methylthiotransferase accessory factor